MGYLKDFAFLKRMQKLTTTRVILEKCVYISRRHYSTVKKTSLEIYINQYFKKNRELNIGHAFILF